MRIFEPIRVQTFSADFSTSFERTVLFLPQILDIYLLDVHKFRR